MPGVIQMTCEQHYSNQIEEDVENDLYNAWNVMPVLPEETESLTDYGIIGPKFIKPYFEYEFSTFVEPGTWYIAENEELINGQHKKLLPVVIVEDNHDQKVIHVKWTGYMTGGFTLVYLQPKDPRTGQRVEFRRYIAVESLM